MKITIYGIGGYDSTKPNDNIVEEYEVPDVVPQSISMRQCRLILLREGLLDRVQAFVEQAGNEAYKIEWEYATEVRRNASLVTVISSELELTSDQVNSLFVLGATL
jgi:hypothetical protein